jgi:hypothetical protein
VGMLQQLAGGSALPLRALAAVSAVN